MTRTPKWGDAPVPDVLARLLRERYGLPGADVLNVDVTDEGLALNLEAGGRTTRLEVTYLRSEDVEVDPWDRVVDAVDALFGQWLEAGRDHRALPIGDDVEHEGAFFRVRIESKVVALERLADQILASN